MNSVLSNPSHTEPPYYITEEGGQIEGAVHNLITILRRFEPMDVLNGVTVAYDSQGRRITIETSDQSVVEENEYPKDYRGISYEVGDVDDQVVRRLEDLKETDRLPDFL